MDPRIMQQLSKQVLIWWAVSIAIDNLALFFFDPIALVKEGLDQQGCGLVCYIPPGRDITIAYFPEQSGTTCQYATNNWYECACT